MLHQDFCMNCDTMLLCHLPTVECGPFDVNADKEYAISMFQKNSKLAAFTNLHFYLGCTHTS
jgi:hypothetical protein